MASITRRGKDTFQAEVRRKGLAKVSKCFTTRKAAEAWARQIETELERGYLPDYAAARGLTLASLLSRYREEVTPTKKSGYSESYVIGKLLRAPIAQRLLANIRSGDFAAHRDSRIREVSGDSVIKELNLISAVYERARKEWNLPVDNPLKLVQRPTANPGRHRRVSADEVFWIVLHASKAALGASIALAVELGLRRSEISKLTWGDIDLNNRSVLLKETKTGVCRRLPLPRTVLAVLGQPLHDPSAPVIGWAPDSISTAFDRAVLRAKKSFEESCLAVGVEPSTHFLIDLRFHDLRHEATSRLFEKGLNHFEVASITGHKTIQMLARYTHLRPHGLLERLDQPEPGHN